MQRKIALLCTIAILVLSLVPALTAFAQDALIESVCLVTDLGRVNDGTFNQFAYEGMVKAAEDFGLDSTFIETQAQTDYATNIQTCVDEGFDSIVTVGFLIADATRAAAEANPEVYFVGVDQFLADGPTNYTGIQFREDQSGFLAGALAALTSESGTVAGVYGIDIPPVVKFRNGFENGAKHINPDINLLGVYIDDFVAPDRGAAAAEQFIGEGADVIFGAGGPTGSGGITAAAQQGIKVIGVDQDEYFTTFGNGETPGAENLISSAVKRVDQGVYLALQYLVEGGAEFPGGTILVMSATNDGVGFAPPHDADVPEEVTAQVQAILDDLKAGALVTGVSPVTGELLPSIAEIAAGNEDLSTLVAAVEAAGLTDTLSGPGAFTVFAPTNAALEAMADADLTYHVLPMAVPAGELAKMSSATTLQGSDITIEVTDSGVMLNGSANVVMTDIYASNGVVHVIDAVLVP